MTTMELKSLKMDLVEELLSLNDKEMLNRVKNYLKRLKKMEAEKEEEEITKEEVLAGIDAGLKEVKLSMEGKLEVKTAREFLMNYEIIVKPTFQQEAKRLAKHYSFFKEDFVSLIDDLEQNPLLGTDLGHGLRKVRMKITSKGKGKSGGARVITFTLVVSQQDAVLNLLYIYDKADRASISEKEIEQLLKQNGLK